MTIGSSVICNALKYVAIFTLVLLPLYSAEDAYSSEKLIPYFVQTTQKNCSPLPPPTGKVVKVDNVSQLQQALKKVSPNTTITLSDGTYKLDGLCLIMNVPGTVLRSISGNRDAVIIDGEYKTNELIQITASNITVADVTLRRAYHHPIHIMPTKNSNTLNTLIYNVHIVDPGEQAIKINPISSGYYTDSGVIACSHIELTNEGRSKIRDNCYTGGIDAHRSAGWVVRDNLIEGFWCQKGISEHAVHFWGSSSDTIVERNVLVNNARGVGFGMATTGTSRVPPNNGCPETTDYIDHFGGIIKNNFIYANSKALFNSKSGFDTGISIWQACRPRVFRNIVYSANPLRSFSSIEWRYPLTNAEIADNMVNTKMLERDGANAAKSGNIENVESACFVDIAKFLLMKETEKCFTFIEKR